MLILLIWLAWPGVLAKLAFRVSQEGREEKDETRKACLLIKGKPPPRVRVRRSPASSSRPAPAMAWPGGQFNSISTYTYGLYVEAFYTVTA